MEKIKKIVRWLVLSSANPAKVSGTIKAVGIGAIAKIVDITNLAGLHFDQAPMLTEIVNTAAQVSEYTLAGFAAFYGAYAVLRKLYLTYHGKNHIAQ